VVTFRGSDVNGVRDGSGRLTRVGRVVMRMSAVAQARADAVIAVSEPLRQAVTCRAPVHVIPSGLDLGLFRPLPKEEARQHLGLPMDERLVLFAADPARALKRVGLAQAAVDLLPAECRARLIVSWPALHEEMPLYMSACDALLMTSEREGSPNVVKEALACDLPVVSVPVGDVAQRLAGISGCAVCIDDRPGTVAADLARVLARGQRITGRQAVLSLDEALLTQRVIDVYLSVIHRPGARHDASAGRDAAAQGVSGSTDA
jgi:glycosyltransferase involved in cell wall biosynthesis